MTSRTLYHFGGLTGGGKLTAAGSEMARRRPIGGGKLAPTDSGTVRRPEDSLEGGKLTSADFEDALLFGGPTGRGKLTTAGFIIVRGRPIGGGELPPTDSGTMRRPENSLEGSKLTSNDFEDALPFGGLTGGGKSTAAGSRMAQGRPVGGGKRTPTD